MRSLATAILGLLCLLFASSAQSAAQGFPSWFTGYYALTPQSGDHFGNWIRTGNVSVDTSLAPYGLRLEFKGPSSGSFTFTIPEPVQLNMLFETTVEGDGLMTFLGREHGFELGPGGWVSSTGVVLNRGDVYGLLFRAGENSRVTINVLEFHIIPEPPTGALFALGGVAAIAAIFKQRPTLKLMETPLANKITAPSAQ